jgi:hypothetical protein
LDKHKQSSAAQRFHCARERRRSGLAVLFVTVDEIEVTDFLITTRFLKPCDLDDKQAVSAALSALIDKIVKEKI